MGGFVCICNVFFFLQRKYLLKYIFLNEIKVVLKGEEQYGIWREIDVVESIEYVWGECI